MRVVGMNTFRPFFVINMRNLQFFYIGASTLFKSSQFYANSGMALIICWIRIRITPFLMSQSSTFCQAYYKSTNSSILITHAWTFLLARKLSMKLFAGSWKAHFLSSLPASHLISLILKNNQILPKKFFVFSLTVCRDTECLKIRHICASWPDSFLISLTLQYNEMLLEQIFLLK